MQVTWSIDEMSEFESPVESLISDDIWKKFDLDLTEEYQKFSDDINPFHEIPFLVESNCLGGSSEIRHHDCMWAGLCISKEHNSTLATRRNPRVNKKVPAGRSLLIPKTETVQQQTQPQQSLCRTKSLESDGDSTRPETPQSNDSDAESDYEPPIFRHDQISINERLSECFAEAAANAVPVSVVTGQQVRIVRRRVEENIKEESNVRNTLNDHCYHLNQPAVTQRLEHLGVQTPSESGVYEHNSESEEEIDVVSYEKPCRQQTVVVPAAPSIVVKKAAQTTKAAAAAKDKPARPRGRPPLAANARKRGAAAAAAPPPPVEAKRPKRSKAQKVTKYVDIDDIPLQPTNGIKCIPPSRSSSDSEPDTEKRSLHNNMERQRRVDLRKAFEDLRQMVPGVVTNDKAPKVSILRQAAVYCDKLTQEDKEVQELRLKQERLLSRVSQLRRECRIVR